MYIDEVNKKYFNNLLKVEKKGNSYIIEDNIIWNENLCFFSSHEKYYKWLTYIFQNDFISYKDYIDLNYSSVHLVLKVVAPNKRIYEEEKIYLKKILKKELYDIIF
jgi:hypothetical protein